MMECILDQLHDNYVDSGDDRLQKRMDHVWDMTKTYHPTLIHHLSELDIVPSVVLLRWIRLLFSRELSVTGVFSIWDRLFLQPTPSFPILDYLATGMLLSSAERVCAYSSIQEVLQFLQEGDKGMSAQYIWAIARSLWKVGND